MKNTRRIIRIALFGIVMALSGLVVANPYPLANPMTHTNTSCNQAIPLIDGYSQYLQIQPSGSQAWYSFVANEPDFTLIINQYNGHLETHASLGRFTVKVFGPFSKCGSPCSLTPCHLLLEQINTQTNIHWGTHHLFETVEIHADDLNSPPSTQSCGNPVQTPAQFIVMIEASFETNLPTAVVWNFELQGAGCCWPEEVEELPALYTCENFYHLTNGNNQIISLPAAQAGMNELWLGITSPAGEQLPSSVLQLSYNILGNPNGCQLAKNGYKLEAYRFGPFGQCDNPCNEISSGSNPSSVISANTNSSGNFAIGTFIQPPAAVEQLWLFRLVFDVGCAPCSLVFRYNLSGSINGFSSDLNLSAPCVSCLPVQGLIPEKKYLITAWVHDPDLPLSTETIVDAEIKVMFDQGTISGGSSLPSGPIIDGWQQIECEFITPPVYSDFNIELNSLSGIIYFDDVRLFPHDGSMKCYVYDPENLRFVAELDERHFGTFYEYDEEGRLTRIKKETERGIMTIQESKTSTVKRPNE